MMKKATLLSVAITAGLVIGMPTTFAEDLASYTLEQVNVTAFGYSKTNLETPADTSVYTGEELAKTGAANVADALKYKAGVYFTQMGPHGQNWITNSSKATLRGLDNGTLVLLNGVPIGFNGVNHLDNIQLAQVERVEVVKGGGSVLYGSSAFGGVINIITRASYTNNVKVALGNEGQRQYNTTFNAGKLNFFYNHDEMGATGDMTVKPNWSGNMIAFGKSLKDNVGFTYGFNDHVNMQYSYIKKDYSMNYNKAGVRTQHFDYDDEEHYGQVIYNNKDFDAQVYYNQRNIDNPDYKLPFISVEKSFEWEKSKQYVYGFNVKHKFGSLEDKFLLGVDYKHEIWQDARDKFGKDYKYDSYNSDEYSIYGQYDKQLSKATDVIISMRQDFIDFNSDDYGEFLPQAQILTKLDDENTLYFSAGKSFRMPNFRNLFYSSGMITPNPDLQPEKGMNYEMGYKYDTGDKRANIAIFSTRVEDQIVSFNLDDGTSTPRNISEYKNAGVEISFARDVDEHFSYNLGATFSEPLRKYNDNSPWVNALGKYQFNGGLSYQNRDIEAALSISYFGDRFVKTGDTKAEKIDSPLVLSNLHVGHRLKEKVKLTLDVNNIFDRKDINNADTGGSLYYTQGRTFLVGLDYSF